MVLTDSFIQATAEDDVTSIAAVQAYLFGLIPDSLEPPLHIPFNVNLEKNSKEGQYYHDINAQNYPANSIQAMFLLVNGLPFYWLMGKATHTITDQKQTISVFDITNAIKPRLKCINQLDESTPGNHVVHGTLFHTLTLHHEPGSITSIVLEGIGCKQEFVSDAPTTPVFPSSVKGLFDVFNYLKWGSDGSEAELDAVLSVDFGIAQVDVAGFEQGQGYYENITHLKPLEFHINFTLLNTNTAFLTTTFSRTAKSLLFKISDSTNQNRYIEIDSNGETAIVESIVPIKNINKTIAYNVAVVLKNPIITVQDYVDDAFYEIPT